VGFDRFKLFPQGPGFLLQLSSGPKYRNPVILDLYGIAGFRVSGFSSFASFDLESAETPQLDDPVLEKSALHLSKEQIQNSMDILFAYANLRVYLLYDLSFGELVHTHPLPHYFSAPANTLYNLCFLRAAVFLWSTPLLTALSSRPATEMYWCVTRILQFYYESDASDSVYAALRRYCYSPRKDPS
jgi:hypothetical protein